MSVLEFPLDAVNNRDRDELIDWLAEKNIYPRKNPNKEGWHLYRKGEKMMGRETPCG